MVFYNTNTLRVLKCAIFTLCLLLPVAHTHAWELPESVFICQGENKATVSIISPGSASNIYEWFSDQECKTLIGTGNSIIVSEVQVGKSVYARKKGTALVNETKIGKFYNLDVYNIKPSNNGILCKNGSVSLTPNIGISATLDGQPYTGTYSYEWIYGGETISTEEVFEARNGGTYTLKVSNSGCSTEKNHVVASEKKLELISGSDALCSGGSVTYEMGGMDVYQWSGNVEKVKNDGSKVRITNGGSYTITASTYDGGCKDTVSFTIEERQSLAVVISGVYALCPGTTSTDLTASVPGASGNLKFVWKNDYGKKISETNKVHITEKGTYTVTVNDDNCQGKNTQQVYSVKNVGPIGLVDYDENVSICAGQQTTVIGEGSNLIKFVWKDSEGNVVKPIDDKKASFGQEGDYTVIGYTAEGCPSDELTFHASVHQNPGLIIPDLKPCTGETPSLEALFDNSLYFVWLEPTPDYADSEDKKITVTKDGTYKAQVTDITTKCYTISETEIEFLDYPTITGEKQYEFCEGANVKMSFTTVKDGKLTGVPKTYLWKNEKGEALSTDSFYVAKESGKYTFSAENAYGCTTTEEVEVVMHPKPKYTVTSDRDYLCSSEDVVHLTAEGNGLEFTWTDPKSKVSTDNVLSVSTPGSCFLSAVDENGCQKDTVITVNLKTQVETENIIPVICEGASGTIGVIVKDNIECDFVWTKDGSTKSTLVVSESGDYDVKVTDHVNYCSQIITIPVTVYKNPTIAVSPETAKICKGTSKDLEALVTPAYSGGYSLEWKDLTTTDAKIAVSEAGTYKVTVTETKYGCKASAQAEITVLSLPVVTLNTTPATICKGESVELAATGADAYIWIEGNTTLSGFDATITRSPSTTTTYTVSGKNTTTGCTSEAVTKTVTVSQPFTVGVTGEFSTCEGQAFTELTATGADHYEWYKGDKKVSSSATYTPAEEAEYVVKGQKDENVCSASKTITTTVEQYLKIEAPKDTFFCEGGSVTVTANGASSYEWTNSANEVSTTKKYTISEPGKYQIVGISATGCKSLPVNFNVSKKTNPTVSIKGNSVLCFGASAVLTAEGSKGVTPYKYKWGSATEFSEEPTLSIDKAGTYTVYIQDKFGCQGTADKEVAASSPVISISGDDQFCTGSSVTLTAEGDAVKYYWNGSTVSQSTYTATETEIVSLVGEDANGCTATKEKKVVKRAVPVLTGKETVFFCENSSATLSVKQDSVASGYVWGTEEKTTKNTYKVETEGTYTVIGYDKLNCQSKPFNIEVKETKLPVVSVKGSATVCKVGDPITLTAEVTGDYNDLLWSTDETTKEILVSKGGTYSVVAKVGECSSALAEKTVTLITNASISIDGPKQFCTDSTVVLKAKVADGKTVNFYWDDAETASEQKTVTEQGTYRLTAVDEYGCKSEASQFVLKRAVPVLTGKEMVYYCENSSTTLSVKIDSVASGYIWNSEEKTTKNTYKADHEDTYTVVGYDTWNCPTKPLNIVVKETKLPVVAIKGNATVCKVGEPVTLTAEVTGDYNDLLWSTNETTKDISVTKGGTYTVKAMVGTCESALAEKTVELITNATVAIEGAKQFCTDSSIVLKGKLVKGNDVKFYWNDDTTPSETLNVTEGGTYNLLAVDAYGCKSKASLNVNKRAVPVLTGAETVYYCENSSNQISVKLDSVASAYVWNGQEKTSNNKITVNKEGTNTVVGYDKWNCPSKPFNIEVKETKIPVVKIEGGATVCNSGDPVKLTAAITGDYDKIEWSTGATTADILVTEGGTYKVTAKVGVCSSEVAEKTVGLIQNASVKIEGVNQFCTDSSIVLTGKLVQGNNVKFYWNGATEPSETLTVTEGGTYNLLARDEYGCESEASHTVNKRAVPVLTGKDVTYYCEHSSIDLSVKMDSAAKGYVWNGGEMTNKTTYKVDAEQTVTVVGYDKWNCPSAIKEMVVKETKVPVIEIQGNPTVCLYGDSIPLTVFVKEGEYEEIIWNNGKKGKTINVKNLVDTTYTAYATISVCKSYEASHKVEVITNSAITVDGISEICTDSSTVLTVKSPVDMTYSWNSHNGSSDTLNVYATGVYEVVGTDKYGCKSTAKKSVKQRDIPVLTTVSTAAYCEKDSIKLTAKLNREALYYVWNGGDLQKNNYKYANQVRDYTVLAYDNLMCPSNLATIAVTETKIPVVNIEGPTYVCQNGDPIELTAKVTGSFDRYEWNTKATTEKITVDKGGQFIAKAYVGVCVSDPDTFDVEYKLIPELSIKEGAKTTYCDLLGVTLHAESPTATVYRWEPSGAETAENHVSKEGKHTVYVEDEFGCKNQKSIQTSVIYGPEMSVKGDTTLCEFSLTQIQLDCPDCVSQTWSTGEKTPSITIYASGTYTVEGIGPNGCPSRVDHHLSVTQAPELEVEGETEITSNDSTTLTAIATGSEPFRYYWTPSHEMGQSIVVHSEDFDQWQNYTVMVYDKNGCYNFETIQITKHSVKLNGNKGFCPGDSTTLTAVGNGITSMKWSTGETTPSIVIKEAGLYNIITTHDNGLTDTLLFEIVEYPLPVVEIKGDLSICRGDSTLLTLVGDAKKYLWDAGQNTDTLYVRESGKYAVTAESKYGCVSRDSVKVTVFELPKVAIAGADTVLEGSSIFLKGKGAVTYRWEQPDTIAAQIEVFDEGRYRVVGTDEHNCQNSAVHDVKKVAVPHPLINDTTDGHAIACEGDRVMLIASGAQTYKWDTGETTDTIYATESRIYTLTGCLNNGQCRENRFSVEISPLPKMMKVDGATKICADSFSVLTAHTYNDTLINHFVWSTGEETQSVKVRDTISYSVSAVSKYGCFSDTMSVSLAYYPYPTPSISGVMEICRGSSTKLKADGGVKYLWLATGDDTEIEEVTTAGKKTLRAWNEFGCAADTTVYVIDRGTPKLSINGTASICEGDSAVLTAVGSQFIENLYLWDTGDTTQSITVKDARQYTVKLTNKAGCEVSARYTVKVNPLPEVKISGDLSFCRGDSALLTAKGNAVNYLWGNGQYKAKQNVRESGKYVVTAESKYGCINRDSVEVTVYELPVVTIVGPDSILEAGSIILKGEGAVSYHWEHPDIVADEVEVFEAGRYRVVGTDENNCMNIAYHDVKSVAIPHPLINDTTNGHAIACIDDKVTLIASGADTYLWDTGETNDTIYVTESRIYTVTGCLKNGQCRENRYSVEFSPHPRMMLVEGASNICPDSFAIVTAHTYNDTLINHFVWSTGEKLQSIKVRDTQTYMVSAVSKYGCLSDTLPVRLSYYQRPTPYITGTLEICSKSTTVLKGNGGVRYRWMETGDETEYEEISTGGKKVLRAWNEYGCYADTSTYVINRGTPQIEVVGVAGVCEGDSAVLTAGGMKFKENHYLWNTGDTTESIVVRTPGTYTAKLSNNSGCVANGSFEFVLYPNPVIAIDGNDYVCVDDSALMTCKQISGNPLLKYSWNTGSTAPEEYATIADVYTLQVIDDHGCYSNTATHELKMRVPNPITVSGDFYICNEQEDVAKVTAYGDGAAFYSWLENADTLVYGNPELAAIHKGVYRVVTTDSFGCRSYKDIEIIGRDAPKVKIKGAEYPVCGPETATLTSASEENVIKLEWSTGDTTKSIVSDHSGDFWLIGTDIYGCTAKQEASLILNDIPGMHLEGKLGFCPNEETEIKVVGARNYLWSNGASGDHTKFHEEGDYNVLGQDDYGCKKRIDFHIVPYYLPEVELAAIPQKISRIDPTVEFEGVSKDDMSNTYFVWSMDDGNTVEERSFAYTFDISEKRWFKVVMGVHTTDGCSYDKMVNLPVDLAIPNTITPNGDGVNDEFMKTFEVEIFDRHGKRVFYGHDGWDGHLSDDTVVADTYYYVLTDVTGDVYRGYITVRK